MIMIPPTSANGSEPVLTHRKQRLVILLTAPLYQQHAVAIKAFQDLGFNLPLLEELLIRETLENGKPRQMLARATLGAYSRGGSVPELPEPVMAFTQALLALITDVWQRPPYSAPDLIVYGAKRYGYHANNLAMEISYRDPLPTLS